MIKKNPSVLDATGEGIFRIQKEGLSWFLLSQNLYDK